ncbi:CMRF35-like molecule 1 [Sorex fumeus]|uniref:CMRF35-like molecule 1 n=1 Tax=Sorex fumeus TaxID=62283 RepID=UPI0024AD2047|nr:CMRF35-like molecule 1 [Sorex fumeus]
MLEAPCSCPVCMTLETAGTKQVARSARVTIRDDQSQRKFTVTMERLRHDDTGVYYCGIERSDQTFQVTVTIRPALTTTTVSTTTTTTTNAPTTEATTEETTDAPRVTRALSNTTGFPVPLLLSIISAVLPLLLLVAALLAWRKLKRHRTAIEILPEPHVQEEVCYAHLSLRPRDPEFICSNADPCAGPRAGRSSEMATEYSSIRKLRTGL